MARNRQRTKQRQAERRAARLAEEGARGRETGAVADSGRDRGGIAPPGIETETGADLAASAPPETAGRSDTVVETPPPPLLADSSSDPDAAASGEIVAEDELEGVRGRNRVVAFLIASWAELKRVQWPTRQQTTTLTGVVIGFVIIMGAYLGAIDAVFSRLIQLII